MLEKCRHTVKHLNIGHPQEGATGHLGYLKSASDVVEIKFGGTDTHLYVHTFLLLFDNRFGVAHWYSCSLLAFSRWSHLL